MFAKAIQTVWMIAAVVALVACNRTTTSNSVTSGQAFSCVATPQQTSLTSGATVSILISASGGTSPYYSSESGSFTSSTSMFRSYTASTTDSVTITDNENNTAVCSFSVVINSTTTTTTTTGSGLACTASPASTNVSAGQSVLVTLTGSGGTAPYVITKTGTNFASSLQFYRTYSGSGIDTYAIGDAVGNTASCSFVVYVSGATGTTVTLQNVYRFYSSLNRDHLFTLAYNEGVAAAPWGYAYEGVGFRTGNTSGSYNGITYEVPLYRCKSSTYINHHFVSNNAACEGVGVSEGTLGYVAGSYTSASQLPIYRLVQVTLYNSIWYADWVATASYSEAVNASQNMGYAYQGILGYVMP